MAKMVDPDHLRLLWEIIKRLRRRQRVWLVWTDAGWEVL